MDELFGLARRRPTLPKHHEAVSKAGQSLRQCMTLWERVCRRLAHMFNRGGNRRVLARCYCRHKIRNCPQIMAPTKVRMISFCGRYLRQSFQHHAVRTDAVHGLIFLLESKVHTRGSRPGSGQKTRKDVVKKLECARKVQELLRTAPVILLPLLVENILHISDGYAYGCQVVQRTTGVFFPLHLMATRMWFALATAGFSCTRWAAGFGALVRGGRVCPLVPAGASGPPVRGYRCRLCGLVSVSAAAIRAHIANAHDPASRLFQGYDRQQFRVQEFFA